MKVEIEDRHTKKTPTPLHENAPFFSANFPLVENTPN